MKKVLFFWIGLIFLASPLAAKPLEVDLNQLLERGLMLYPDLKKKYHELKLAYLQADEVFYKRLPNLDFNFYFNYVPYMYREYEYTGAGTITSSSNIQIDFSKWTPFINPTLTLYVPIYTFGKISNGAQAADYNIELKKAELEESEAAVKYEIKRIYWSYAHLIYISQFILKDVVEEYEKNVLEKENELRDGKINRKAFEDYKIDYLNWKRNELELDRLKKELQYWLKLILNAQEESLLVLPGNIRPVSFTPKSFSYYANLAKKYNYALKKSYYGNLARKYLFEYQKSDLWPDVYFGAQLSYVKQKFASEYDPANQNRLLKQSLIPESSLSYLFSFGLKWNLSFWNKSVQYDKAKESYANDLETLRVADQYQEIELRKSYDNLVEKKKRLELAKEQFKASKRSLIFSINAYKSKTNENKDEYLNAIVTLYHRKRDFYQCIYDFNLAMASFEKMLGIDLIQYKELLKPSKDSEDLGEASENEQQDEEEKE